MEKKLQKVSLLDRWKNRENKESGANEITKAPEGSLIPLSNAQQNLWFLQQLYPTNPFYNESEQYKFKGALNIDYLKKTLQHVFDSQSILKSYYPIDETTNAPIIKINPESKLEIETHDLSTLSNEDALLKADRHMSKQANFNFDLSLAPLIKASLIKISSEETILFLTLHHIITDIWTKELLREQLSKNYISLSNNEVLDILPEPITFLDYAYWQRNTLTYDKQVTYWKNKLSGEIPVLNLPLDHARPLTPSFKGKQNHLEFPANLSNHVLELAKKLEVTPFVLFLSAYFLLLQKFGQQNDILIGSPVSNRSQKKLESIFGFFIDTVVFRNSINPELTISEFIKDIRQTTMEVFANKDAPLDVLVKALNVERSLSLNPFFQVTFVYTSDSELPSFGTNVDLIHNDSYDSNVAKFDLTLFINENNGVLSSTFEYATDLFEEATIVKFQQYLQYIIECFVSNPDSKISEIPAVTPADEKLLLNDKTTYINPFKDYHAIHSIIEDVCVKYPNNTAITFKNDSMSYGDLKIAIQKTAQSLINQTHGRKEVVALCIDRSLDMIIGLLGILKAGCAYLPIDPEYPEERINFMLEDSNVNTLLTQKSWVKDQSGYDVTSIFIEDILQTETELSTIKYPETNEEDLAYVIYTSGSTGQPKGVPITHKNIINSTGGRLVYYHKNPLAFLLLSSVSFDSSKAGIFWTLCTGGNLVIAEKRIEQDINMLETIISSKSISHTLMLPSLYKLILDYSDKNKIQSLNTVVVAGEACTESLCEAHFKKMPQTQLYNEYGPTEATVWCIAHEITNTGRATSSVPIGKPVAGAKVYLLDKKLQLVPYGAVGEIYIGGVGLSKGYFNRPDLTDVAFIKNPFITDDILYKTGDLGRFRNDGNIEFLGRSDQQIKIRGYRVEIEEIENVFNKHGMVRNTIVLAEQLNESQKRLVAYFQTEDDYNESDFKRFLKKELPDYMIPSSFIIVDSMPLLPNGKINKKALSKIENVVKTNAISISEEPKTDLEKKLIGLWQEVLGIDSIGVNDNFFEIGGDSLLSVQVISKARKSDIQLSPSQLFEHQTIKELAYEISNNNKEKNRDYVTTIRKEGAKKPLFCIHSGGGHVFFYSQLKDYLAPNRPIYALSPTGIARNEKLHRNVEEMSKDYLKVIKEIQPKGPYNILVYCFSVSVGNEMSILLESMGEEVNIISADTMASAWNVTGIDAFKVRSRFFLKNLYLKPSQTLKLFFQERSYLVEPFRVKYFGKAHEKELERLKANLRKISVEYQWKPHNGKVSLILSERSDENFQNFMIESWGKFALGGVKVKYTSGQHTALFKKSGIKSLSEKIDDCMID